MYLIEMFLPLADNNRVAFPREKFTNVEKELAEKFGGVTAYPRAPASGLWGDRNEKQRDDLIIYEVVTEDADERWWKSYRQKIEHDFDQEEILIRSHECRRL